MTGVQTCALPISKGGGAQVATGNGNKLTGDSDVDFDKADGPVNVAAGHDIRQNATEDSSQHVTTSDTVDLRVSVVEETSVKQTDNSQTQLAAAVSGQNNEAHVSPEPDAPLQLHTPALAVVPGEHPGTNGQTDPSSQDLPSAPDLGHAPIDAGPKFDDPGHGFNEQGQLAQAGAFAGEQHFGDQGADGHSFDDGHPFDGGLDNGHDALQDGGHTGLGFEPDDLDD